MPDEGQVDIGSIWLLPEQFGMSSDQPRGDHGLQEARIAGLAVTAAGIFKGPARRSFKTTLSQAPGRVLAKKGAQANERYADGTTRRGRICESDLTPSMKLPLASARRQAASMFRFELLQTVRVR
jgi:hypothetical protein